MEMKEKIVGDISSLQYEYYSWLKEFAEIVQISLQKDAWLYRNKSYLLERKLNKT
jgi:hypothetical protein